MRTSGIHNSRFTIHNSAVRRVALKVDCDTRVGTREGVPRLLDFFAKTGIRATFFFSFGPDRSGVAVRRVFTRPGFVRKMLRSRAVSLYGFPTILYGTLLPAPLIGERCAQEIRSAREAGHETGVHAWDHVGWHDRLDRWTSERIREESGRAHEEYRRILGSPARAAAAPGWTVSARSLEVEEERELLYTSNSRGGAPFFPELDRRVFRTLEIPSTLPTLDETLAWPELPTDEDQQRFFRTAVGATEVHTIHAEVEGRSKLVLFSRILEEWKAAGVTFLRLEELAREALELREKIPVRTLVRTRLPGRGGTVATGWPGETGW
ncbi:MAG TPA: polysaccharide deacetylase family protein [Thermoanaerobaculia bacterium]|nr:polysaccharide deacetylase family protein [Thermoanaerobaculia bacterium]